jgi:hypothetical protein
VHRVGLLTTAAILLVATGCDLGRIDIPFAPSSVVIHGVLTATADTQTVLVERTRTGEFPTTTYCVTCQSIFSVDGGEPIVTDGGVPERGATAVLTTPTGQTITARELSSFSSSGNGAGVYVFALAGSALVPGGAYQLRVVTKEKEIVTAQTIIPEAAPVRTALTVGFDRGTDTLALAWPSMPPSPAYQVRIESPYGAWSSLTDSTHIALTGGLRSLTDNLPRVFVPGFRQILTVSAVDANLYDYYRSTNNSFTGSGIIGHVHGALGVFGSLVTVTRRTVNVTASITKPVEGTFDLVLGTAGFIYGGVADARSVTLYIESAAAKKGQPDAISGSYTGASGSFAGTAMGTFSANHLTLAFLRGQSMADTLDILSADLRGDTLAGTFIHRTPATYIRR